MSIYSLLVGAALLGQIGRDYQPLDVAGGYPFNTSGAASSSPATGIGSAAGGVSPPPAAAGASGGADSAYRTGAITPIGGGASSNPTDFGRSPASPISQSAAGPPPNTGVYGGRATAATPPSSGIGATSRESSTASTSKLKPAGMMRAMMEAPTGARLNGNSITLEEVVAGASRGTQAVRVEAYWDLCSSVADYYLGLREQQEIAQLRRALPRAGGVLDNAERALSVRVGTAEHAARSSQFRLASLIGMPAEALPLPATPPHCGNYQTKIEQVFAGRRSIEAEELHQLIPLRFAELEAACGAVNQSQDMLRSVAGSMASTDDASVVRAFELLALERRAFVQIARDYNRRIARYAELAAPGTVGPDQFVSMLIMRDPAATATRPTWSTPPRSSQSIPTGQPTLAGGIGQWNPIEESEAAPVRDGAITPVSAQELAAEPQERSLIVPRR